MELQDENENQNIELTGCLTLLHGILLPLANSYPQQITVGIGKLHPTGCFCVSCKSRLAFKFFKNYLKKNRETYDQRLCGPKSLKYTLSCPLQKKSLTPLHSEREFEMIICFH